MTSLISRPVRFRPGWVVIRGDSGAGKSLLSAMLASRYDRVCWLATSWADDYLFDQIEWRPTYLVFVSNDAEVLCAITRIQSHCDLIVLDSLTELGGNLDRQRGRVWFRPLVPIVCTAHERGRWTHTLRGARVLDLRLYRQLPALYTWVRQLDEWLVWWPGRGPVLRPSVEEDELWLNKEVFFRGRG